MKENQDIIIIVLGVIMSIIAAIVISQLVIKDLINENVTTSGNYNTDRIGK